jgi:hypothetical protein
MVKKRKVRDMMFAKMLHDDRYFMSVIVVILIASVLVK